MSYKYKIQEIAEMMADDDGKDYSSLSDRQRDSYYKKAYEEYLDRMADRADMMRKNEADGGFMRQGYAMGTDEDDIPEAEDIPMDEYMELLKSLGAPVKGQESGIKSIKSPIQKASMDENEELFMRLVDDLMERGFSLQEAIEEAKREFEERSAQRMIPSANKMADVDPNLLDEYLKYVDEMKEMGREPMSLREFEAQARAGLKVGGLASII